MKIDEAEIIIAKYLSGEASAEEIHALDHWRASDGANEQLFNELSDCWRLASLPRTAPHKDTVWGKIASGVENRKPLPTYTRNFIVRLACSVAVIALVAGAGMSLLFDKRIALPTNEITITAPGGQKSEVALPDGTSVWLNSGSSITYNNRYNISNRNIRISGEAFFDVKHNKTLKFVVNTDEIAVVVHGTAFDVKAYEKDDHIDVSLVRGRVAIHAVSDNRLLAYLTQDQKATVSKGELYASVRDYDAQIDGLWRNGQLKIIGEPTGGMIEKISRWYGVNITVGGNTPDERYWLTVKTESLTDALKLIDRITPIDYAIDGEEVTIIYK